MPKEAGYENQTAVAADVMPRPREHMQQPVFDSPEHKARYTEALRTTPRRPDEDVCDWLDRVTVAAAGATARQARLPCLDSDGPRREPGEEG